MEQKKQTPVEDRRDFLKRAGTTAVAAPAAALVLAASSKNALAGDTAPAVSGLSRDDTPTSCWVAREVYGAENPRWLEFRAWMLTRAPVWFRELYIRHGARIAAWISNKPLLKRAIRSWMDARIQAAA